MTSALKREMDLRGIPERELRQLPDYSNATKQYRGQRRVNATYALHYCRLFGIDPRILCPDLPWDALKDIPLSSPPAPTPATNTHGVFSMTNKNTSPTTFVFSGEQKPVISSKAFGAVYPGSERHCNGNLMVKIRAAITILLADAPDFVANNIHIVLSPRRTHRQREILMTEEGARAVLQKIRARAPKYMSSFVEAALAIVDERFSQAPAPAPAPAPATPLDEALARNVALSSRAAELEREIDDLREKVSDQEGWLDAAEEEKAALRKRIAELEEAGGESKTTQPEKVSEADSLAEVFRAAGMDAVDSVCAAAEFVYGRSNVAQYWAKRDTRRRRDAEIAAAAEAIVSEAK